MQLTTFPADCKVYGEKSAPNIYRPQKAGGLMTLKQNWERGCDYISLSNTQIQEMAHPLLGDKQLLVQETHTTGCANTNIKLTFSGETAPLLLRILTRDKFATKREQALYKLVHKTVPVPEVLYVGQFEGFDYAIVEYVEGILFRDLILKESDDYTQVLHEAGVILKHVSSHQFDTPGFFESDLSVKPFSQEEEYGNYVRACLENDSVKAQLGEFLIDRFHRFLEDHQDSFPDSSEASLVHGDYDPANILVEQKKGVWRVKAILDWEFAFSGSPLFDVGTMLRFADKLPATYKDSFITGLKDARFTFPPHWQRHAKLLDLLSLLHIMVSNDPKERPKQIADVKDLIEETLSIF